MASREVFLFQNNPQNLDLSVKTDLDFGWIIFKSIAKEIISYQSHNNACDYVAGAVCRYCIPDM